MLLLSGASSITVGATHEDLAFIEAHWGTVTERMEVAPGDLASPFTVSLQNVATSTVSDVQARLTLPTGFRDSLTQDTSRATAEGVPSVPAGGTFTTKFTVDLLTTAQVQTYTTTLEVEYQLGSESQTRVFATPLTLRVPGRSSFFVTLTPATLVVGSTTPFAIIIQNQGGAAASTLDVVLTLPGPTAPLTFVEGQGRWQRPSLAPGQSMTLNGTWAVSPTAPASALVLTLTLEYRDTLGVHRITTFPVGLRIAAAELNDLAFQVELTPAELVPGSRTAATLQVTNVGTAEAHNVRLTLTLPTGAVTPPLALLESAGDWRWDQLNPGAGVQVPLILYAAPSSVNTVQALGITLEYEDAGGSQAMLRRVLYVQVAPLPAPDIEFDAWLDPSQLVPGAANDLILHLANRGSAAATDLEVTLTLPPSAPSQVTFVGGGNQRRVARLEGGQTVDLPVTLFVSSAAQGAALQLQVAVTYADPLGLVRSTALQVGAVASGLVPPQRLQLTLNATLTAGLVNEATLRLQNLAPEPLREISLALTGPRELTIVGADRFLVAQLEPGESIPLPLSLFPAATLAGTAVSMGVTAQYVDGTGLPRVETLTTGIYVTGLLRVTLVDVSFSRRATGEALVTGTILNEGNVAALFTRVAVRLPALGVEGPSSDYLGDLNPNAQVSFAVPVNLPNATNPGEYPVEVVVTYQDALRSPQEARLTSSLTITPPTAGRTTMPAGPDPLLIGVAVAVGVGAAVVVWRRRRRQSA